MWKRWLWVVGDFLFVKLNLLPFPGFPLMCWLLYLSTIVYAYVEGLNYSSFKFQEGRERMGCVRRGGWREWCAVMMCGRRMHRPVGERRMGRRRGLSLSATGQLSVGWMHWAHLSQIRCNKGDTVWAVEESKGRDYTGWFVRRISPTLSFGMDEENIDVVIRVRPLRSYERERGETTCVKIRERVGTAGGPAAAAVSQEVRIETLWYVM